MANPRPVAPPVTRTVWSSNRNVTGVIMLPLSRLEAAVDVDRLPGDVGGVRRDEEGDDGGDLRSCAMAPEGHACPDGVAEVLECLPGRVRPPLQRRPVHLGVHVAGADAVHPNAI